MQSEIWQRLGRGKDKGRGNDVLSGRVVGPWRAEVRVWGKQKRESVDG